MRVKSRHVQVAFEYSKSMSRSFFVRAERVQICFFLWCHDPPRTPQTLSAGQGPDLFGSEQMSELHIRPTSSDTGPVGPNQSGFRRFRGVRTYRKPRKPRNRTGHSNRENFVSWEMRRVLGLPIWHCAASCNNHGPKRPKLRTIDVEEKAIFERLYLVSGLGTFWPRVNCPYAPTPPPLIRQLFLDFCTIVSYYLIFKSSSWVLMK